ncbi:Carboxypeptidase N subunit 2 [Pontoporia blainvillei]|uniref:Carboxypeptidase N subunit 2 n=1 Tax=Pontoporia blainvillei TaxID=48723 RepID=A0ABX0RZM3_PONBL|nr:Carboxypeptidase N subunit 2 [Pontoporia blainvillei]
MLPRAWLCWACLLLLATPTQPCPKGCDCFIREVFCSDEELAAIPLDIPPHANGIIFVETSFTVVGARAFSGSPNLTKVVFLNTQVCHFGPDAFGGLPGLRDLEITGGAFSNLSTDIFSNLTSLGKLTLNFNMLEALPEGLFQHMDALESLQLQGNRLQMLPGRLFQPLRCLKTLNLAQNLLAQLPEELGLEGLVKLYLGSNNLTALHPALFQNLSMLELLSLSRNLLTTLPQGIFDTNYNLFNLALHSNPWQCDCHLAYLFGWLHQYSDQFFNSQTYCAGPAYLKGQVVPALREEQLVCPVTQGHLGFQVPGPEDRDPGGGWDLTMEEKATWGRCIYSTPEGTVVLACDEARCRWLNVQLSPRQGSASPGLTFNATQEWDLKSSCGSVRVTVSIEALAGKP